MKVESGWIGADDPPKISSVDSRGEKYMANVVCYEHDTTQILNKEMIVSYDAPSNTWWGVLQVIVSHYRKLNDGEFDAYMSKFKQKHLHLNTTQP